MVDALDDNAAIADAWFVDRLREHLPRHLTPFLDGVGTAAALVIEETRAQTAVHQQTVKRFMEENAELRRELAKLITIVNELRCGASIEAATTMHERAN
jgi:hypothetical protein